jgi:hypothetical protein
MMERETARSLPRTASVKPVEAECGRRTGRCNADNRRLSPLVALASCSSILATLGCGMVSSAPEAQRYQVDVRIESDPSKPLAAVGILQGAKELSRTRDDGSARVSLAGRNGDAIALSVACPEGYASPDKPLSVTLRPLLNTSTVPQYRAHCEPLMRSLVVAVRAKNGANLAVKHLGNEIARTDADGVAHALLKISPAEQVTLVLDTSGAEHERLRPKSPEFSMTMPARDEVAVFDQTFSELVPPAVKKKREAPKALGPVKIEAPGRASL